MELHDLRTDYGKDHIEDTQIPANPLEWFKGWIGQAMESGIQEPNAMVLSTVSASARPSSRVVLLKELDNKGFVFFSNYESRKGQHLAENPQASLLFFWPSLERQVRIEGWVELAEKTISDEYFKSRPGMSRISAIVSPQSKAIPSRSYLEGLISDYRIEHPDEPERPGYWGGYRLIPELIEFWQGRSNRLHDRIQYHIDNGDWKWQRLAP